MEEIVEETQDTRCQIENLLCKAIELCKHGNLSSEDLVEMLRTLTEE